MSSVIAGTMGGCLLALVASLAGSGSLLLVTVPIEIASVAMSVSIAIVVALAVGRDHRGLMAIAATLIRERRLLLISRAIALAIWVFGSSLVVLSLVAIAALAVNAMDSVGFAVLAVLTGAVASTLFAIVSFSLATVVRHGAPAVLLILALVVIPFAVRAAAQLLPDWLASAAQTIVQFLPFALLVQGVGTSSVDANGVLTLLSAQVGLALWAVGLSSVAMIAFRSRDL